MHSICKQQPLASILVYWSYLPSHSYKSNASIWVHFKIKIYSIYCIFSILFTKLLQFTFFPKKNPFQTSSPTSKILDVSFITYNQYIRNFHWSCQHFTGQGLRTTGFTGRMAVIFNFNEFISTSGICPENCWWQRQTGIPHETGRADKCPSTSFTQ